MSNNLRAIKRHKASGKPENISPDLLGVLQSSMRKLEVAQIAKNAIVQEVIERYKLSATDSLDLTTGQITREVKQ